MTQLEHKMFYIRINKVSLRGRIDKNYVTCHLKLSRAAEVPQGEKNACQAVLEDTPELSVDKLSWDTRYSSHLSAFQDVPSNY